MYERGLIFFTFAHVRRFTYRSAVQLVRPQILFYIRLRLYLNYYTTLSGAPEDEVKPSDLIAVANLLFAGDIPRLRLIGTAVVEAEDEDLDDLMCGQSVNQPTQQSRTALCSPLRWPPAKSLLGVLRPLARKRAGGRNTAH
jgi:hypothetical protein